MAFRLIKGIILFPLIVAGLAETSPHVSKANVDVVGHKLHLGMTKAQVMEQLAGTEITKIDENEWMVGSLDKKEIGPALQFTNGLLSYAERFWTVSDNDTVEQLFGVVSSPERRRVFPMQRHRRHK